MEQPTPPKSAARAWQFGTRHLLLAVTAIGILLGLVTWFDRSFLASRRHSHAIQRRIESLVQRRPPQVTRGQWASAVAWTLNLHGNSMLGFKADARTLIDFEDRFDAKLAGNVDRATIAWIWDEYAKLTPHGANYQKFREVMLEEMNEVGPNDDPWGLMVP